MVLQGLAGVFVQLPKKLTARHLFAAVRGCPFFRIQNLEVSIPLLSGNQRRDVGFNDIQKVQELLINRICGFD